MHPTEVVELLGTLVILVLSDEQVDLHTVDMLVMNGLHPEASAAFPGFGYGDERTAVEETVFIPLRFNNIVALHVVDEHWECVRIPMEEISSEILGGDVLLPVE